MFIGLNVVCYVQADQILGRCIYHEFTIISHNVTTVFTLKVRTDQLDQTVQTQFKLTFWVIKRANTFGWFF